MHQFQHRIAATLQGDMEMGHKRPTLGTVCYQFVGQQVGFQTADAVALNGLHPVECLHQINELLACGLTKVAYVHTGEHNLLATLLSCFASLRHQRFYRRVSRKASGVGNGAVSTEVVAAVLYLQEIPRTVAARTAGCKTLNILGLLPEKGTSLFPTRRSSPGIRQELNQIGLLVRAQHQAHAINLRHLVGLQLGITSRHHHKGTGVLPYHTMDLLTALLVGHLSHRTSIDQTYVRPLTFLHRTHTQFLKHLPEGRCLRKVQLTSEGVVSRRFTLKGRSIYHI